MASEWTLIDDLREDEERLMEEEAQASAFERKAATYLERAKQLRTVMAVRRKRIETLEARIALIPKADIITDEQPTTI